MKTIGYQINLYFPKGRIIKVKKKTHLQKNQAKHEIWKSGNLKIWKSGNLEIWKSKNLAGNQELGSLRIFTIKILIGCANFM